MRLVLTTRADLKTVITQKNCRQIKCTSIAQTLSCGRKLFVIHVIHAFMTTHP